MRKYQLASTEYRNNVDLRENEEMIKKAVHEFQTFVITVYSIYVSE